MHHSYFHEPDCIFRTKSGFSMGDHSALLAGSVQEQDSHGSRGKFNRAVDSIHPTVGVFIHPISLDFNSGYISPPIIPRIKRRSTKSSTHLGSRSNKLTL